jgi:putative peptide zinc metalloprotease protein
MNESLYSPSWYRVAGLKPRLRSHVQLHRHFYRDDLWYVLQDHSSGKVHRFSPAAYQLIGLMDGRRTVQEIWDIVRNRDNEEPPTQDEFIRLLRQLHVVDVLQSDVAPDTGELMSRYDVQKKNKLKQNFSSPFAIRIPLLDPEKLLNKLSFIGTVFFSKPFFLVWCLVLGIAIFQAGVQWSSLTENISDRVLAPGNLVMLWFTFPLIKACHEFGHAFAVKAWGGEVHEMGIMFLVFTPIPYIDASSASAFRARWKRVIVGAAGMMVEVFIGASALLLWLDMEPGTARSLMYNIILIAGVSTLLFNGNPLLRYDGYYILSDLVEIPNLAPRGNSYLGYLFQRYLLEIKDLEPPVSTRGERIWFVCYTVLAFIYRLFVFTAIILFVADKFFIIGILLACWGAFGMIVLPSYKGISFLIKSPAVRPHRLRAVAVITALAVIIGLMLFVVPVPLRTMADGVVWIPDKSFLRPGTDIFVEKIMAPTGSRVKAGELLIKGYDPLLPAEVKVLESKVSELKTKYNVLKLADEVEAEIALEEMRVEEGNLARARERMAELDIHSNFAGRFIVPQPEDLPGHFIRQGEVVGYVLEPGKIRIRLVVPQDSVDLVRYRTRLVQLRFIDNIDNIVKAKIIREVPGATDRLPSTALGNEGGGEVAIDPRDSRGQKAFQHYFDFELELLDPVDLKNYGGRVVIRFDHGFEPLFFRIYRQVRRLFLRRFNV